jgi:hypothetical protein
MGVLTPSSSLPGAPCPCSLSRHPCCCAGLAASLAACCAGLAATPAALSHRLPGQTVCHATLTRLPHQPSYHASCATPASFPTCCAGHTAAPSASCVSMPAVLPHHPHCHAVLTVHAAAPSVLRAALPSRLCHHISCATKCRVGTNWWCRGLVCFGFS